MFCFAHTVNTHSFIPHSTYPAKAYILLPNISRRITDAICIFREWARVHSANMHVFILRICTYSFCEYARIHSANTHWCFPRFMEGVKVNLMMGRKLFFSRQLFIGHDVYNFYCFLSIGPKTNKEQNLCCSSPIKTIFPHILRIREMSFKFEYLW